MLSREIAFRLRVFANEFHFSSRLGVAIVVGLGFCMLVGLAVWQVARLQEKLQRIEQLQRRVDLVAVDYRHFRSEDAFTRVRLVGRFDGTQEQYLLRRHVDGRPGWHVLTPMILSAGRGVVFVDRGWVDFEHKDLETRPDSLPVDEVEITGLVRVPSLRGGWLLPEDDVRTRTWYREDLQGMAQASGYPRAQSKFYFLADTNRWAALPQGRQWSFDLPNNHASYAATWALLSLGLLAVYGVATIQRKPLKG